MNWSPQELAALQQLREQAYNDKNIGAIGTYAYGEYAINPNELEDNIRLYTEYCEQSVSQSALERRNRRKLLAALLATRESSTDAEMNDEIDRIMASVITDMDEDGGRGLEDFEELDFARCQRPDGTHYGSSGQCRKGKEVGAAEQKAATAAAAKGGVREVSSDEAWDKANEHDWSKDKRFKPLWQMIRKPDEQSMDMVVEELKSVMKEHFGMKFDPYDGGDVDIIDELDDLQQQWGS